MVNLTFCSSGLIETHQQMVISALNIPLSVTAFLGNLLIIIVLQKPSSLHPPSKLLLGCLAFTDLCVGLIIQPLFVTFLKSSENLRRCYYVQRIFITSGIIFCGVSLMTLTVISVDRLFALLLGLRYRQVVTLRRVRCLVATLWLCQVSISTIFYLNSDIFVTAICTEGVFCIITLTCCYYKIYLKLRQHHAQVQGHAHQGQLNGRGIGINLARYKKTVSSALWVQTLYLVSYIPFGLTVAAYAVAGPLTPSLYLTLYIQFSFVFLNSSLNPFLYCWKMREVRQAVKNAIRGFWCPS